jgi:succinate dehydrogenase / fumarate reductase membrane anchor subunit
MPDDDHVERNLEMPGRRLEMKKEREHGINSGGAFQWFAQRISGAVLLLALLVHFWVLHFFPAEHGEITFRTVMERLNSPVWKTIDLLFLVCALYHGMNGLIMNVHDYVHHKQWRMAVIGTLWVVAIFYLILGSLTILGLTGRGA